jgi:cysteine desulfurase
MKSVYLDHASATPVRKEVMEAMLPYFEERFGNPSTVYDLGSEVKDVVEAQRSKVAKLIGAKPSNTTLSSILPDSLSGSWTLKSPSYKWTSTVS